MQDTLEDVMIKSESIQEKLEIAEVQNVSLEEELEAQKRIVERLKATPRTARLSGEASTSTIGDSERIKYLEFFLFF